MTWLLFSMIRVINTPECLLNKNWPNILLFFFYNYDSSSFSLVKIQQNNYDLFKIVREPRFTKNK